MIKIYVIASNEDKQETRNAINALAKREYEVHDWTAMNGNRLTIEKVENDFKKLMECDCALVINASRVTPGKYIEIGACKAWKKPVIFIGKPAGVLSKFGIIVMTTKEAIDELDAARLRNV